MAVKITNPAARLDNVYDLYRNCMLNELYYGLRLKLFLQIGFWIEVGIAIGSGTSGVSGWLIWTKYPDSALLWGIIAGTATLLAALKPVLRTDMKIKRYSALFSNYRQLALSMKMVVEGISEAGGIPRELDKEIDHIKARYRILSADDDPNPDGQLVDSLQDVINLKAPPSTFYYPPQSMREVELADEKALDVRVVSVGQGQV
jgi:hypothetical protein